MKIFYYLTSECPLLKYKALYHIKRIIYSCTQFSSWFIWAYYEHIYSRSDICSRLTLLILKFLQIRIKAWNYHFSAITYSAFQTVSDLSANMYCTMCTDNNCTSRSLSTWQSLRYFLRLKSTAEPRYYIVGNTYLYSFTFILETRSEVRPSPCTIIN